MRNRFSILGIALVMLVGCEAEKPIETVSIVNNYKNWQWDSVFVAKNKYISLAVVPQAAGRMLEYNLGDVPSLWLNPKLFGKSFAPNDEVKQNEWRNFGGYRLVPIPVGNCAIGADGKKSKRWPPPVVIGDSPYKVGISTNKDGIQSIDVESGIQELPVPSFDNKSQKFIHPETIDERLQYKRSLHIETGSSLVFIKHTLINRGDKAVKRGIMTTSQNISRSKPDLEDGENFRAYIPFDKKFKLPDGEQYHINVTPESHWRYVHRNRMPLDKNNPEHVKKYFNHGTNWNGEVAPGIFEIEYDYYLMGGFHMISSKNWLCYVIKTNNTAFVKIMEEYDPSLEYDFGVNAAIYNSGMVTGYLETEVKTPIHTILPGESFDYQEIQGAAKIVSTPILDVNRAGIITQKLNFDSKTNSLNGQYGVFHEGKAILRLLNESGGKINDLPQEDINPLKPFTLKYLLGKNENPLGCQLLIKDTDGIEYLLDSFTF
ncbi:hypothetical protein [Ancylomarina sp. 16SWW S1-10-2]|uniref:hypothetical protein n=1 Tax=Ancylomarina sp. 16SWW S1-10-2 TaxID=2499681 RepID=UPI0012AE41B0|nr:hypothetical protein [Ancylomarina sp. 16SWW S1-10-2]MRT91966.1 hypothetical protein [Ancylomarina sp. 16SWW S1-10-2]